MFLFLKDKVSCCSRIEEWQLFLYPDAQRRIETLRDSIIMIIMPRLGFLGGLKGTKDRETLAWHIRLLYSRASRWQYNTVSFQHAP